MCVNGFKMVKIRLIMTKFKINYGKRPLNKKYVSDGGYCVTMMT